jgi:hypothetical protein
VCPAILLLASLLDSGPRARLDLGVETSVHASSEIPGQLAPDALRGGDIQPSLTLRVGDRTFDVESRYAARLLATPADSSVALRHDATLRARWDQGRNLTWLTEAHFDYGQSTFVFDPGQRRPFDSIEPVQPLIRDQLAAEGSVGISYTISRTTTVIANAAYAANGGASADSQQLVPLLRGPQLYAGLLHDVSRVDQLSTDLYASQTTSSDGRTSFVVKATGGWTRQLAVATRASASLGASVDGGDGATGNSVYPVAAAQLQHDVEARTSRIELRASTQVGPHYSVTTGELQQRAEIAASVRWVLRSDLAIRARAAAAHELTDASRAGNLLIGAVDLSYRLGTDTALRCGFESVRQSAAPDVVAPTSTWFAFAAFTATARNLL